MDNLQQLETAYKRVMRELAKAHIVAGTLQQGKEARPPALLTSPQCVRQPSDLSGMSNHQLQMAPHINDCTQLAITAMSQQHNKLT